MTDFENYLLKLSELGIENKIIKESLVELRVWAKPASKKEKLEISDTGEILVFISEKPVEGKANKAFSKVLAKTFGIPNQAVELSKGEKSKHKKFILYFEFTKAKDLSYYLDKLNKNFK